MKNKLKKNMFTYFQLCSKVWTLMWWIPSLSESADLRNCWQNVYRDHIWNLSCSVCYNNGSTAALQTVAYSCQMEKRNWSLQRTRLHCSRVQWRCALHHCIRRFALHLLMYGLDAVTMETHSMKLSKHCSWANLKATWSLEVCSDRLCRKLATSAHCAPQHPLTPLCHFMWPTTSWLSCCRFQMLPLCYNITDNWLWNI